MADLNPLTLWRRLLALPNESRTKAIVVAFLASAISAVLVSTTAVVLAPMHEANRAAERQARLDALLAELPGLAELLEATEADTLETLVVDLETGAEAEDVDPAGFEMMDAARDPERSTELAPEEDIAGIGRRPDLAEIFVLRDGDAVELAILPIWGTGYQSTIRAYLALQGDLNTVAGLSIVEHAETPGLGARISEPSWRNLWPGKKVADAQGDIVLEVVRGRATNEYEVDGITGATRTSNAITNMVRFWLGENGYEPVLDRLRAKGL